MWGDRSDFVRPIYKLAVSVRQIRKKRHLINLKIKAVNFDFHLTRKLTEE